MKAWLTALALAACLPCWAQAGQRPALSIATVTIPAGPFIAGSDRAEREAAYRLDEAAYGHRATRKGRWYENEPARHDMTLAAFSIMKTPVTNALYARFIRATGHAAPFISAKAWAAQGLAHPYARVRGYLWTSGKPPRGRERHPAVLVTHADAEAFARWLSAKTGRTWLLPTEAQWEKAMRGTDGRMFPWGGTFDAAKLNSADAGPFSTMPAGSFPAGASPFGALDGAGQVYEWTATPYGAGRFVVKGGSWDDKGCGVCRPAARHGRPEGQRHILIGIRLVRSGVQ